MNKQVKKLIRDAVNHSIDKVLFEYALPMDRFMNRYMDLSQQILENWCLIRYSRLIGREEYVTHWKHELRGHILTLARLKISANNTFKKRYKTILRVWQELEYTSDIEVINKTINNKFQNENFDTHSEVYYQVLNDCRDASSAIVNVLANAEITTIDSYIESL